MPEVSKATLKTYFEDGKEPDENKYIDLVDTLWEQGGGVSDHGDLTGLGDDDHPQYLLVGAVDHGDLTGLGDDDHSQYLLANGTRVVSGDFTVGTGAGAISLIVDGAAGTWRNLMFRTGGVNRWIWRADTDAESGSNVGSDLELTGRADDGAWLNEPIKVIRATGDIYFAKDIRIGGGLYVGSIGVDPIQSVIQAVSDIRAGGGLVVGSVSPNPAAGHGVMSGGLSIGNLTPPYEVKGTIYFDFGTPSYGFLSAPEPLFISSGTIYDGANWRQLGSGKSATLYISNTTGIVYRVDNTSRSPGDINAAATIMDLNLVGSMRLAQGVVIGYVSGTATPDGIVFYSGTTKVGEIGSDNTAWLKLNYNTNKPIYSPRYMRIDGGVSGTANVSDPGDGAFAAQRYRLYESGTEVGRFDASDTTWLRINQSIVKNVYSPRSIVIAGGLMSGTSALPGAGGTGYTSSLRPYKNSSFYTTYSFHAYATKKTSGSFNGDPKSTTGATKIDLSAVFGVPSGVKAVSVRIYARDSGGHILTGQYLGVGPSSADPFAVTVRPVGNDQISENTGITTCDGNGDIYWRCGATGGGTLDIWIEISGYFI